MAELIEAAEAGGLRRAVALGQVGAVLGTAVGGDTLHSPARGEGLNRGEQGVFGLQGGETGVQRLHSGKEFRVHRAGVLST